MLKKWQIKCLENIEGWDEFCKPKLWWSFEEAKKFIAALNLHSHIDWFKWCQNNKRPDGLPSAPNLVYKNQWVSWGDYLGTGSISDNDKYKHCLKFKDARNFIRTLGLKSLKEWQQYTKSGNRPLNIPGSPEKMYKNKGWSGYGDWLGTGVISNHKRKFRSFASARNFVRNLKITTCSSWKLYHKKELLPLDIPTNPNRTYKKEWKGWGDWFGTFRISDNTRKYRSFDKARKFARNLRLSNHCEWLNYWKIHKKPEDIPLYPDRGKTYKDKWKGWCDFLGLEKLVIDNRKKNV